MMLVRNPDELPAWHLVDQFAMMQALTDLRAHGWTGSPVPMGDSWRLELNTDDDRTLPIFADVGDWLVLDMGLRKLTGDQPAGYRVVTQ